MHTLVLMGGTRTRANVTETGTKSGPGMKETRVVTRTKVADQAGLLTSRTNQETGLAGRLVAKSLQTARAGLGLQSHQWVNALGQRATWPLVRPTTRWTTPRKASSS